MSIYLFNIELLEKLLIYIGDNLHTCLLHTESDVLISYTISDID